MAIRRCVEGWNGNTQDSTNLEGRSPAQPNDPRQLHKDMKDLVTTSSINLETLTTRLEAEITLLDFAHTQKRKFWVYFRKPKRTVRLYIRAKQLEELISATKSVEASLGVTLLVVLCYKYNAQYVHISPYKEYFSKAKYFRSIQQEEVSEGILKQFNQQTEAFEKLQRKLDRYQKPMIKWDKAPKPKRGKVKSRQKGSHDIRPRTEDEEITEKIPVTSAYSEESCMSSDQTIFPLQVPHAAPDDGPIRDGTNPSAVATTLEEEESVHGPEDTEAFLKTLNADLDKHVLRPTTPDYNLSAVMLAPECPDRASDVESDTSSMSSNENEIYDSNSADQLSEAWNDSDDDDDQSSDTVLYDSHEITIQSKMRIYLDVNIDLSICFCSDTGVWKFCTASLNLFDNGEATFELQNPCETDCEHISIQTESGAELGKRGFPENLGFTLCSIPMDQASPTTLSDQPSVTFTAVHVSRSNNLTKLVHEQGVIEWVACPPMLTIVVDTPRSVEDEEGIRVSGDEEQNADQEENKNDNNGDDDNDDDDDKDNEDGDDNNDNDDDDDDDEVPNTPDKHRRLAPFSSVPCVFCQQDALNPRWSGGGNAGFLIGSNTSLRVTCERCNDSTWISAMTWGPSFPGGSWRITG
jgi:hypothetical protein